jgi:hypothetical protein
MARFVARTAGVVAGAVIGLVAGSSVAAGLAGAGTVGAGTPARATAVAPGLLTVGPYKVFLNGVAAGTITFASNFKYSSDMDGHDAGRWIDAGQSITFDVTAGADAGHGCVFVGNLTSKTTIDTAARPGKYSCPGAAVNGTWYVKRSGAGTSRRLTGTSAVPGVAPSAGGFATGKYAFWANNTDFGTVTYANGHTFSGTSDDDGGSWVVSGRAFAMMVSAGGASDLGCLFVGTLTSTGVNSSASPAPYTGCEGDDLVDGTWWAKAKK